MLYSVEGLDLPRRHDGRRLAGLPRGSTARQPVASSSLLPSPRSPDRRAGVPLSSDQATDQVTDGRWRAAPPAQAAGRAWRPGASAAPSPGVLGRGGSGVGRPPRRQARPGRGPVPRPGTIAPDGHGNAGGPATWVLALHHSFTETPPRPDRRRGRGRARLNQVHYDCSPPARRRMIAPAWRQFAHVCTTGAKACAPGPARRLDGRPRQHLAAGGAGLADQAQVAGGGGGLYCFADGSQGVGGGEPGGRLVPGPSTASSTEVGVVPSSRARPAMRRFTA